MTTDPVRAGITEKQPFLRSAIKCFFGQKCILTQKNTQNFSSWAKKVTFWVKTVLLGQEVQYYMVYIAYFTELNSKI